MTTQATENPSFEDLECELTRLFQPQHEAARVHLGHGMLVEAALRKILEDEPGEQAGAQDSASLSS